MPKISVILPVYNGEKYLRDAIDSIFQQSFTDFELLVINDGSTDSSESIILSYYDERLVYIKNEVNRGLVHTLNLGIDLAKGKYIARMDADDISVPERLHIQCQYLDANPEIDLVAGQIEFIDSSNKRIGSWKLDRMVYTSEAIRKMMPKENCLAHPTIAGKKDVFAKFRYKATQKNIEDYDLWLRMLNAGVKFSKIARPLLLYRVHSLSVTQSAKSNILPTLRVFQCKKTYLAGEVKGKPFTIFNTRVFFYMLLDGLTVIKKKFFR